MKPCTQQQIKKNRLDKKRADFVKKLKGIVSQETAIVERQDGKYTLVFPPTLAEQGFNLILRGLIEKYLNGMKKDVDNFIKMEDKEIRTNVLAKAKGDLFAKLDEQFDAYVSGRGTNDIGE